MRYLLAFIFLLPLSAFAQVKVYASTVAGTYRMNDMKDLQQMMITALHRGGLPFQSTLSFPASVQGELGAEWKMARLVLGGFANYTITKGSIRYADYSGEQTNTQKLSRYSIGVKASKHVLTPQFSLYSKAAFTFTTLEFVYETQLTTGEKTTDTNTYNAYGLSLEPGVQWDYRWQRLTFFAHGGYQFQFSGKTSDRENDYTLTTNDREVRIDWSGVRIGIGVGFALTKS